MIDKMIEELKEKMVLEFEQEVAEILDLFSDVTIADFNIKTIEKRLCKKVFDEIAEKYRAKEQTLEQIKWERDCAISQLEELGTGLGEMPEIARQRIQEQKWISVEERLPKLCEDVLIVFDKGYVKNEIATGYLMRDGRWITYDGWIHAEVIAWMPLPEYHFAEADKKVGDVECQ